MKGGAMGEMDGHETRRLSGYLDGTLAPEDAERVERHLDECGECRDLMEELRAVRDRARSLEDRPPAGDLWPGVARRIQAADAAAADGGSGWRGGEVVLSRPEFAAAAAVLLLVGGTLGWLGARTQSGAGDGAPGEIPAAVEMAGDGAVGDARGRASLARLERTFRRAGAGLTPERRATLERNLAIVDSALAEARRALRESPDSPYLRRHTVKLERRKAGLLRLALRVATDR